MGEKGGKRPGAGRKKGVPNKNNVKFPGVVEKSAEKVMERLLKSKNADTRYKASRYVLEHNRGKPSQQFDMSGGVELKVTVENFTDESFGKLSKEDE